ncbi:MAG: c-type cytochrome [Gammaproteobacteria bacterium]|nr:c-type cytochrome [Gammaproteobacteria bacterium]
MTVRGYVELTGNTQRCSLMSGYNFGHWSAEGSELGSIVIKLVALCALICLTACDRDDRRQGDIYLPGGDAARGEMHFVSLGCVGCHSVIGAELPEPAEAGPVRVLLGSRTGRRMSYGQLVTSIVNPSHRLSPRYRRDEVSQEGESLMTSYNDVLTVTQLTDLVAFLQAHYEKADRPGYKYPVYTDQSDDDS